jgi:hypothetical protein
VNGYLWLWLAACCCQPGVAGGVIYADLRGELSTHLAPQALFTQSSPVHEQLLQAFPFPSTLGKVTLHPLSQTCVFTRSSRGKWVFPPLLWSFPPTAAFTSFPAPGCWTCATAPALSGQAWLIYLQFCEGFPSPPLRRSACSTLFAMSLSCSYCLLLVSLFFPGWGSVCPGGYADLAQGCLWEYRVPLSSPCGPRLPKSSRRGCLAAAWGPSWFLHST